MKKILLSLLSLGTIAANLVVTISCGSSFDHKDLSQKDFEMVLKVFKDAKLSINTDKPVEEVTTKKVFNKDVLKSLGGTLVNGDKYPTDLPNGIKLTYSVPNISIGSTGKMIVTVTGSGSTSKNFTIDVNINKDININTEKKAIEHSTYAGTTLTIGPDVSKINFKFSYIYPKITKLVFANPKNIYEINNESFKNTQLKSLNLSGLSNLTKIGQGAFSGVQIKSLDLSSLKKLTSIGEGAFWDVPLKSLNLSGLINLTNIGRWSFHGSLLTSLDLSSLKNLAVIGDKAFYQYESQSSLESLYISGSEKLKIIGDYAFANNKLKSLNLSELLNLISIGTEAFKGFELKFINLSRMPRLHVFGFEVFKDVKENTKIKMPLYQWKRWRLDEDQSRLKFLFGKNWKTITRIG